MFFVDANIVIYAVSETRYRPGALAVIEAVAAGASGATSVSVLEEVWHLERSGRLPGIEGVTEQALDLFWPPLAVTPRILRAALRLTGKGLGTADLLHVATCHDTGILDIVTADQAFDHAPGLRRIDPLDRPSLDLLLA